MAGDSTKERLFNQGLKDLVNSPVDMVDDFQKPLTKTVPVDKIDTRQTQKIKTGADFQADQIIRNAKQEAKLAALGKIGDTIDYSTFRKGAKTAGKKLLGAVPVLGGIANAILSQDASAAVPLLDEAESLGPAAGTFDSRIANGTLTEEDKQQLRNEQARVKALQSFGK